jgi:hypothetical protein
MTGCIPPRRPSGDPCQDSKIAEASTYDTVVGSVIENGSNVEANVDGDDEDLIPAK